MGAWGPKSEFDGYAVADDDIVLDESVVTYVTAGTDACARQDMCECPDAGAVTDRIRLDDCRGMLEEARGCRHSRRGEAPVLEVSTLHLIHAKPVPL